MAASLKPPLGGTGGVPKKFTDAVGVGLAALAFKAKLDKSKLKNQSSASMPSVDSDRSLTIQVKNMDDPEDLDMKLEDQLTNEKLIKLEKIFEEADEDGGGGLDMDEFRHAMRQTMGDHVADHDLDILFMKVDTNCDGTVDWDEYLSYMLLEYRASDMMNFATQQKPLPRYLRQVPSFHHDSVIRIELMQPSKLHHAGVTENMGRYITSSREGVVNLWGLDMTHQKTFSLEQPTQKNLSLWVTDVVYLPNLHILAVSTTSDSLAFYDMTANKFTKCMTLTDLDVCALCLNYWFDQRDQNTAILLWGDARGNVCALKFYNMQVYCFLNPTMSKSKRTRIPFPVLLRKPIEGVIAYKLAQVHNDFVRQIMYVPNLGCFISCCKSKDTAMYVGDLDEKKTRSYFRVNQGVFTFDFCRKNNVIATGGYDTVVRVWNPYVPRKAVMLLQGHKSPVTHVAVHSEKEQIISLGEEKEIHIHDMTTQNIVQTIFRMSIPMGCRNVSAMFYNPAKQALILANNQLAIFQHQEEEIKSQRLTSHDHPVNFVLYNKLFNQVVSAGSDSMVCVWNIENGDRLMQFRCHKVRHLGEDVSIEITAMTFDTTCRRLITGARDGTVKIWNFNNGACLRVMESDENQECSGIVCFKQRIITAGWNKKLTNYVDDRDDDSAITWPQKHREDILTLSYYSPNLVASGSYDGDIIVWSVETGHVLIRLNAYYDVKPVPVKCTRNKVNYSSATSVVSLDNVDPRSAIDIDAWMENFMHEKQVLEKKNSGELMSTKVTIRDPKDEDATGASSPSSVKGDNNTLQVPSLGHGRPARESSIITADVPIKSLRKKRQTLNRAHMLKDIRGKSWKLSDENKPRAISWPKSDNAETFEEFRRKNESSVDKIIFLQTRPNNKHTAILLTCGAEGWVRAWSVHHQGGLLGQFNAAHKPHESVVAMTTDPENEFLITGDTAGYIKVWHIADYCTPAILNAEECAIKLNELTDRFPFLRDDYTGFSHRVTMATQKIHVPPPECTNPNETHEAPLLLNSFRAHLGAITCIDYVPDREMMLTCSDDCSVRLWSIYGQFVGIFGQDTPWKKQVITSASPTRGKKPPQRKLPSDVRRVASATSLKVLNNGVRPGWRLARNILMVWMPCFRRQKDQHEKEEVTETDSEILSTVYSSSNFINGSPILGKTYKQTRRHWVLPSIPRLREHQTQVAVYGALKTRELDPIEEFVLPPIVQEIQERYEQQHKSKMAAIMKRQRAAKMAARAFNFKLHNRKVSFNAHSRHGSVSVATSRDSMGGSCKSEKNLTRHSSHGTGNKDQRKLIPIKENA